MNAQLPFKPTRNKELIIIKNISLSRSLALSLSRSLAQISKFQNSMTTETGLSDCHKMTVTVLKTHCKKLEPLIINYRKYNNFNEESFREELRRQLEFLDCDTITYDEFRVIFILNWYAPL